MLLHHLFYFILTLHLTLSQLPFQHLNFRLQLVDLFQQFTVDCQIHRRFNLYELFFLVNLQLSQLISNGL